MIEVEHRSGFKFHLDVRAGRPVNPLSPTRRGLIEDAAYESLIRFVGDEVFRFVFNPDNREQIKPEYVAALFRMDNDRARRESPYIVAAELLPVDNPSSLEDLDCKGEYELFTYDAPLRLLEEGVTILLDEGETHTDEHGLSSFIKHMGKCYTVKHGDRGRLKIESLWWKPGRVIRNFFHEPGECGIGTREAPPVEWHRVEQTTVFSFTDVSNWDVEAVDWIIGTADDESIDRLLRTVIGNCVPFGFTTQDLQALMPTKEARIEVVRYHYAGAESRMPQEITATNAQGEEARLRLL